MNVLVDVHRPIIQRRPIFRIRPRFGFGAPAVPLSLRRGALIGAVVLALVSAIVYILAVNALLLHGAAMERAAAALPRLERDISALEEEVLVRRSPSWLAKAAGSYGMVEATGVRYLTPPPPVALSR